MKAALGRPASHELLRISEPSWDPVVPMLKDLRQPGDTLLVSNSMKALYYFGDYDYEVSATIVEETRTGSEFGIDGRTGRRVVSRASSIARIIAESERVVVVIDDRNLGRAAAVTPDAAEEIRARCRHAARHEPSRVAIWTCAGGDVGQGTPGDNGP
jgi:hypothetical protein